MNDGEERLRYTSSQTYAIICRDVNTVTGPVAARQHLPKSANMRTIRTRCWQDFKIMMERITADPERHERAKWVVRERVNAFEVV
jgi:hypothetical protein